MAELRRHVGVGVFGDCGGRPCDDECVAGAVEAAHMFYLAFENSVCADYVTEKLFERLQAASGRPMVPVVMGGAQYADVVPERSVIDVRDFDGPADLAKYLGELVEDEHEYLSYFWWRDHYKVVDSAECLRMSFCRLCEMLNEEQLAPGHYEDFAEWWRRDGHCLPAEDIPWARQSRPRGFRQG